MTQDPNILNGAISRVPASDQTTLLVPVDINSSNQWTASTAGGYSDGTLQDTGESPSELTAITGNSGARFVRGSGTCTAGSEASVGTLGYENAVDGDIVVGLFLTSGTSGDEDILMLPYERGQYQKGGNKIAFLTITGASGSTGVFASWVNPEGAKIIITRAILDVQTVATAAATLDIGVTASSATTSSATLLDGVDVNGALAVFDSMNAALDGGANALAQSLASGGWITVDEASGNVDGLVAQLRIEYYVA